MIDHENEVYTAVRHALKAEFPDIAVSSEYRQVAEKLPHVYFEEIANSVVRSTQDSGCLENHVRVNYNAEVFSGKVNGKKAEAKAIAAVIDDTMQRLGFTRTLKEPFPNESDATIYRIVMRYRGVIGRDGLVYTS